MRRASGLVMVTAALLSCTSTGPAREVLLADAATASIANGRTCVRVGDGPRGSWCGPADQPEAVWLGATTTGDKLLLAGQAPTIVESMTLRWEGGQRELMVERTALGRFFVGLRLPLGQYVVEARRADGSIYVSGELSLTGSGTVLLTFEP